MLSQDSNTVVQHCNAYVGIALEWCASRLSWLMPKGVLPINFSHGAVIGSTGDTPLYC